MFGSHDHDEDKHDDNAPAMEVASDNGVVSDHAATTPAPAFDTSNVSLPSVTPAADDDSSQDDSTTTVAPPHHDEEQLLTRNDDDDLIHIKQEALQQLSPLVDHLDQSPEEKFRTTMMMIQASDDQSLLHTAYEAAKNIKDDKTRAQALLDVINEINYFTQPSK